MRANATRVEHASVSVCRVTQALYPDLIGGLPIQVHEMSNAQRDAGLDVEVHTVDYGRPPEGPPPPRVAYRLVRHRRLRMPWDAMGTAGNPVTPSLFAAVLRSDASIVHLHSHLFFTSFFGAVAGRVRGKAVVTTVHGVRAVRDRASNALQELWMRTIARIIFGLSDRIICLTQADAAEVARYADARRIVVLSNGFDAGLFRRGGGARAKQVLWVGRFVEEKGLTYLLDAWASLRPLFPEHKLVLVGDGPLGNELRAQARDLKIEASVDFRGRLPQADIAALMRESGVFVLPSLQEGFPKSILEAMASACPVVTTDGLRELVGDAGAVVPARDPASLARALGNFMGDSDLARRAGEAGAARADTLYAWPVLEARIRRVYEEVLHERAQRPR